MKTVLITAIFLFLGSTVLAKPKAAATPWSLHYLARASNFLVSAYDESLEKADAKTCGLDGKHLKALSPALENLVHQKLQSLSAQQRRRLRSQAQSCKKDCTCDVIAMAFKEDVAPAANTRQLMNLKSSDLGPKERSTCAQHFQEFCHSDLFNNLKSNAAEPSI